ncbi:MAG: 16S rRNA (cytosine(1402)-N(4))-methyltransferase RsmH [Acidobacteria bacterium]|nr:16S rRNA (cytosine(1402)-N(4))-methyltransferase RsmH [Acidobacteriota bacterium]
MTLLHRPVMVREVVELLAARRGGVFVDATFGGGGHTREILAANPANRVLACDRDRSALAAGRLALARDAERVEFIHDDYRRLPELISRRPDPRPQGIVVDMGISTIQLLDPARGFAFGHDGPLDMRMNREDERTAADLVNQLSRDELRTLISRLGEERFAARISRALVQQRERQPFTTTGELAACVREAYPAAARRQQKIDPATRTFQALRIAVNDELTGLEKFVEELMNALAPGARAVFIAFHSLEDRPVKHTLRRLAHPCVCPPDLPVCGCGRMAVVRLLTPRAVRPGATEVAANPASRSARLRAAERIAA